MGNIVQYGSYEMDAAEEEEEDLRKSGGAGSFLKIQEGKTTIRILPPPAGRRSPFVTVYQHFINRPGQPAAVFNCPQSMAKTYCRVCAKANELKSTGNRADRDQAFRLFAKRRVFAVVIDRGNEEAGPQIYGFGKTVQEQLVAIRRDQDAGGDFTHPEDGFDLVIERKGTGKTDTSYKVLPSRRSSALGNMDWIAIQPDLRQLAEVPTLDEIKAKLNGEQARREDFSDAPAGGGRLTEGRGQTVSRARSSAADDANEDDDYEEYNI